MRNLVLVAAIGVMAAACERTGAAPRPPVVEEGAKPKTEAPALHVVVLIQGNERFMGNLSTRDETGPRDPSPGAYEHLGPAIGELAGIELEGAKGAIITYGRKVIVRRPMGAIGKLGGDALGPPQGYHNVATKSLEQGVTQALDLLEKAEGRRVLVVVGDGGDVNASWRVDDAVARAKDIPVEIFTLRASPRRDDWDDPVNQERMAKLGSLGGAFTAPLLEEIAPAAREIAKVIDPQR